MGTVLPLPVIIVSRIRRPCVGSGSLDGTVPAYLIRPPRMFTVDLLLIFLVFNHTGGGPPLQLDLALFNQIS